MGGGGSLGDDCCVRIGGDGRRVVADGVTSGRFRR